MAYESLVDYEYYYEQFNMDATPPIPEADFSRMERIAWQSVNFRRIIVDTDDPYIFQLKDAVCAVAELLYNQRLLEAAGSVRSFSNDGYSESYANNTKTVPELSEAVRAIINNYLSGSTWHNRFVSRMA